MWDARHLAYSKTGKMALVMRLAVTYHVNVTYPHSGSPYSLRRERHEQIYQTC